MKETRTDGIVLKAIDYRDKEKIATVFTKEYGLISLIIKGISQKNHHLLAASTPFHEGEFLYLQRSSDLFLFQDCTIRERHLTLRCSYTHLQAAGILCRLILRSQLPSNPAPLLYSLLSVFLKKIPLFEEPRILVATFYLKILKHEGFLSQTQYPSFFSSEEKKLLTFLALTLKFEELIHLKVERDLLEKIERFFTASSS